MNMRTAYLADHKEVIPKLAEWFHQEWSYLYPERTIDDIKTALDKRTNKDCIPVVLVAFEETELVGTVCLKTHDMDNRLDLSPWLAGLYVAASWRGKGMGTALVKAIEQKAKTLGIRKLYLYTPSAVSFYTRMSWRVIEAAEYHGAGVTIMEKEMTVS